MSTVSIENLSPELLKMIANFLPPSDILKLSLAIKKAAFLRPDFDQVEVNNNNMIRAENYRTILLDIEVSAAVNEVMVTFKRETEMPVCNNFSPVVFKRNLFVTEDATTYDLLSAKEMGNCKVSTLRGKIAEKKDRLTVEVYEDFCCKVFQANITVFYTNKRTSSAIPRKVNPLNIIPSYTLLQRRNRGS